MVNSKPKNQINSPEITSPTKGEDQATSKHVDFRLKERIPTYTRVGNMDSTNVKIFFGVGESFEKK